MPTQHYLADPPQTDATGQTRPPTSNRFDWFSRIPPEDGPVTESFLTEFLPGLTTIVGSLSAPFEDLAPPFETLGYRTVSWDESGFPGLQHVPGLQFSVRTSRPESIPEVTDIALPPPANQNLPPARVLLNRSSSQSTEQPPAGKFRPSLFIDFNRPQRAVGLEFGFQKLQQSPAANLRARGVRLIALGADGQPLPSSSGGILASTADLLSGNLILSSAVDQKVGVRSQTGEIMSVELRFEHDGDETDPKIVEQQAVLRIWHEILPPAVTLQGTIAVGSVPSGFVPAPPLGTQAVQLPFNCDRAVVLVRGMRQETTPLPSGIREMGSGFVRSLHATSRGGVVNLTPFFHYRGAEAAGTSSGLVYFSLLAWNSREVELGGTEFSDTFSFPENGGNALLQLSDPLPSLGYSSSGAPQIFRAETEARHGPLVAALNGYHFLGTEDFDPLDVIQLEAAPAWFAPTFLKWGPFDPTRPTRQMELTITSVLDDADVPSDRSFTGSILTGRSLRATPDASLTSRRNGAWLAMLQGAGIALIGVPTFRPPPSDPSRFHLPPESTGNAGLLFPVRADMAVVGLWAMQFFPGMTNIFGSPMVPRAIEWELLGSGYDGKNVDWRGTGAMELGSSITSVIDVRHTLDLRPTIFGVTRDWDFATSALNLETNVVIFPVHQGPPIGGLIILRNNGRAQANLQWIYPGPEPAQDRMHYEYEWRGQRFTNFADRAPLQLRSGEWLLIFAFFTPDPSIAPTAPEFSRNVTLEIYPSGSAVPLVATITVNARQPYAWWVSLPAKTTAIRALRITGPKTSPATIKRRVRLISPIGLRIKSVSIRNVTGGKPAIRFSVRAVGGLAPRNKFARTFWDFDVAWTRESAVANDTAVLIAETFSHGTFTLPVSGALTR
ncbi:MAG: hypothetical protein ABIY47_06700 [Opitutaceae bacterium]